MAVEGVEIFQPQTFGVDQVPPQHVEREREPAVDADVAADAVAHLVGKRRRFTGRRVAGEHARSIPFVADVHVW